MILLLSNDQFQSTLDEIILWLKHYNGAYIRLNDFINDNDYTNLHIDLENDSVTVQNKVLSFNEINAVWYYRFGTKEGNPIKISTTPTLKGTEETIKWHLNKNNDIVSQFFFSKIQKDKWYNFPKHSTVNKLHVLSKAKQAKINIPKTIVSSKKDALIQFIKSCNNKVITKPIWEVFSFSKQNILHSSYTSKIDLKDPFFKSTEDCLPTLLQEDIPKRFEIRSFYLAGDFYSMAIFSQQNNQTKSDFRVYDKKVPNRTIPFQLPKELEEKLDLLMTSLNLKTGSIDLIYTTDNKYIFLEVNPVGQFGMTSSPCNYNLEKIIAKKLIKNDNETKKPLNHQ